MFGIYVSFRGCSFPNITIVNCVLHVCSSYISICIVAKVLAIGQLDNYYKHIFYDQTIAIDLLG